MTAEDIKTRCFFTADEMRGRGWSRRQVAATLGRPDAVVPHSEYSNAPPVELYKVSRVFVAEESPSFAAVWCAGQEIIFVVPNMARNDLERKSWEAFQNSPLRRAMPKPPKSFEDVSPELLRKLCVHWLRFQLMAQAARPAGVRIWLESLNKTVEVSGLAGMGNPAAVSGLRRKVFRVISDEYPWLTDECCSQFLC